MRERVERVRHALAADRRLVPRACSSEEGWHLDLAPFRYLSHFITPPSSPIRFTARFFLAPVPAGQEPRLLGGEASEGFWIDPAEGSPPLPRGRDADGRARRTAGSAISPGSTGSRTLWAAHADGRHKFHGILDRIEAAGFSIPRGKRPGQG